MSTAVMFPSRKWRRMAMALQPQQLLSSSMVTPGANRAGRHKQHLGGWQKAQSPGPQWSHGPPHPGILLLQPAPRPSLRASCKALQPVPQSSPYSA